MLGILLVLMAMSSLSGASYKIGGVMAQPPEQAQSEAMQQQYNISLVVAAIAFMVALCGILMATTGWNPFSNLSNMTVRGGNGGGVPGLGLL